MVFAASFMVPAYPGNPTKENAVMALEEDGGNNGQVSPPPPHPGRIIKTLSRTINNKQAFFASNFFIIPPFENYYITSFLANLQLCFHLLF
jgi:hypothetical protein